MDGSTCKLLLKNLQDFCLRKCSLGWRRRKKRGKNSTKMMFFACFAKPPFCVTRAMLFANLLYITMFPTGRTKETRRCMNLEHWCVSFHSDGLWCSLLRFKNIFVLHFGQRHERSREKGNIVIIIEAAALCFLNLIICTRRIISINVIYYLYP